MDESTIEYLELKWRRQSPRVFLRGGASVQRLRLLRRGVRSPRINHTTLYINSWQSEYKFSFSLYFKYLVYFIFGNNWVNVLDTDKETLILPCYLYRFSTLIGSCPWSDRNSKRIGCILGYRKTQLFKNNALFIRNALYLSRQNKRFWKTTKAFVAPLLRTRLTAPGSPRVRIRMPCFRLELLSLLLTFTKLVVS